MAGNEWINGYLEAILDAGGGKLEEGGQERRSASSRVEMVGGGVFNLTKYFVEEVVTGFDETDLYRTWVKVIATRNSRERNNRLENMCWRIWHLARKKKKIATDDARQLAKRRLQCEQGRKDAAEDLSEDLSEGEKDWSAHGDSVRDKMSRIGSDLQNWTDDNDDKRLYIVLISLHGLVRGENMELGRDSDTGGQVKYVVELARALAATKGVHRVDLLTRQISSPDVDWSYGEPTEMLTRPSDFDGGGGDGGAYIVRLPCGPRDKYIPKESLWPHIPEFVDAAIAHVANMARVLADQFGSGSGLVWPYVIHGHYADAGEVAARISGALNVPMVLTGHSLGRNKFEQLLKQGRLSKEDINNTYRIMRRIEAEEYCLDAAEMVVTSTRQEIEEQWGLYDGFEVKLERKLRARARRGVSCHGRFMPRMVVIPPGMDFSYVNTQELLDGDSDITALIGSDRNNPSKRKNLPPIWSEVMRFFTNPHKPMILALSRPDPKKNVTTLLKAFGECRPLRELANMTLILGNRDDIEVMSGTSATVLTTVLKLIDKYDLYGQVAYPKRHKQTEVPEIYRLAAKTKGVFINPALVEPFGLTLIEAAAYGLPVVATKNGGPVDILKTLNNGLLIDPHDDKAVADALLRLVSDKTMWQECRKNGLRNISRFSWPEHCRNYLSHVAHCRSRHSSWRGPQPASAPARDPSADEPMSDSLRDVNDLSIRFSLDAAEVARAATVPGTEDPAARRDRILSALRTLSSGRPPRQAGLFGPGRRQRIIVFGVDCYSQDGSVSSVLPEVVRAVMSAGEDDGRTGFVIATGATLSETWEALRSCQVEPETVDALVCGSGGEVYYPWKAEEGGEDEEYGALVDYRWAKESVQSAVARLARVEGGAEDDVVVAEDEGCSSRCFRYAVKPGAKVVRVDDLKQKLRMRGFRCNVVYAHAGSRLNVVPLSASRSMALRYLSIRWGINLSKFVVLVGEKGDTDYECLLPGLHKALILKGTVGCGSERLLRSSGSYGVEDVVPKDGPNIATIEDGSYTAQRISAALEKLYW